MGKDGLSYGQRFRRAWTLRQFRRPQLHVPSTVLGTTYGAHAVCLDPLDRDSIVYSFGLGKDISFDLELIARIGCRVHGFDPTPESIAWVRAQQLPAQFELHEYGLSNRDGKARFFPPKNPAHISHTLVEGNAAADRSFELEVRRLSTIAEELGHSRIDVLKMDIEGAEYAVIEDLAETDLDVRQVLVEYHHQFKTIGAGRTRASLRLLNRRGFRVFHASGAGREISLIKRT